MVNNKKNIKIKSFGKILILCFLTTCSPKSNNNRIDNTHVEFNQIVDEIVRYKLNMASVVLAETMPIYKTIPTDSSNNNSQVSPPDMIIFTDYFFDMMIKRNLIDSIDAEYMLSTIDSSMTLRIDSNIISKPTVSKNYIDNLFEQDIINLFKQDYKDAYICIEEQFGTSCFIEVGTPVFNKSKTNLILSIDYLCGYKNGVGYIFILKKVNGKWIIVEELQRWES